MNPIEIAATLARPFEGLFLKPYLCPAGVPTIGRGTTRYPDGRKVTLQDPPITADEAEVFMLSELAACERGVLRCCPDLDGGSLGAIIDFAYNLGIGRLQASTLRRKLNEQDFEAAADELRKWVWAGGRKLNGLVLRREAEAKWLK